MLDKYNLESTVRDDLVLRISTQRAEELERELSLLKTGESHIVPCPLGTGKYIKYVKN